MEDEVASLLALFNSYKKTGKSATLILSTQGGDVTAKLEVKLINAFLCFIIPSSSFNSADSTWLSTTTSISCKEDEGKRQGSPASATPGAALPRR